jgi:hypothetical protein
VALEGMFGGSRIWRGVGQPLLVREAYPSH